MEESVTSSLDLELTKSELKNSIEETESVEKSKKVRSYEYLIIDELDGNDTPKVPV